MIPRSCGTAIWQPECARPLLPLPAAVDRSMTGDVIVAKLGTPQQETPQSGVWEVRYDAKNYDSLTGEFDAEGHVTKMTKAHNRRSQGSFADFERGYSYNKQA